MNKAKVSIIIPAKNEEKYLPRLLESIKKQTTQPYEIIVADAGSTDRTVEVAKKYGAKVIKGGIPQVGRNNGAKQAKTDIIVFLDADVILPDSNVLKALCNFMAQKINAYKKGKGALHPSSRRADHKVRLPPLVAPIPIKHVDYTELAQKVRLKSNIHKLRKDCKNTRQNIGQLLKNFIKGIANSVANVGVKVLVLLNSTYIVTGQIICTKNAFERLNGFNEAIRLGDDVDFVRRARKHGMFIGWAPVYVYVSDRRNKNILHLITAPFLLLGGLLIELVVLLTKRQSIFYWWMDKVVAPLYGQLGGVGKSH